MAITFYLIYYVFIKVDGIIPHKVPGLGILVIVVGITVVGFLFQTFVTSPVVGFFNKLLKRAPLLQLVYSSIKDLFSAFVGKERKFELPVLVTLDKENGIKRLGFLTQKDLSFIGIPDGYVSVYFPSSYGILGELYVVPSDMVEAVNAHSAEVMKFIVSGGVSKVSSTQPLDNDK